MSSRILAVLTVTFIFAAVGEGSSPTGISNFDDDVWTNMTLDTETKHSGDASGRWDTAEKYRVIHGTRQNWTHYDFVDLWVHCPEACDTDLWIKCHYSGTNARWGYYYQTVTLDWTGWRHLHLPMRDFEEFDPPFSWARIDRVTLEVDPASGVRPVLHIDDFGVSKNALVMSCPSPPNRVGEPRSPLTKPEPKGAPGFADAKVWFSYGRGNPGDELIYYLRVENQSDSAQTAHLQIEGGDGLDARLEANDFEVPAGDSFEVRLHLTVPQEADEQFRRIVTVQCTPDEKDELETLPVRIAAERTYPCVAFTSERLEAIRKWIQENSAAARDFQIVKSTADRWDGLNDEDTWRNFDLPEFGAQHRNIYDACWACAQAYAVTGEKIYGQKAAAIFRKYADPETGYLSYRFPSYYMTRLWHQNYMGQTRWVGFMARAYDCLLAGDFFTPAEQEQIEWYVLWAGMHDYWNEGYRGPNDGNATTIFVFGSAAMGTLFNDPWTLDDAVNGPLGYRHLVGNSVLDEGFWYEGSWSYHSLSRSYLTMAAHDLSNTIPGFQDEPVPTIFDRRHTTQRDWNRSYIYQTPYTVREKTQKEMFDCALEAAFPDGSLPGLNDGSDRASAGGDTYAMGYYLYCDPRYLSTGGTGDYRFPVSNEPAAPYPSESTLLPSAGMATLRAGEGLDIACYSEFGSPGGGHGHFDQLQFVLWHDGQQVLDDPGYGPGYGTTLREEWYLRSIAHNCVTVDGTCQWPSHGRLLFFGDVDDREVCQSASDSLVPGVMQRRTLMLDDTVLVVIDDLTSDDPHTYDWACHPSSASDLAADVEMTRPPEPLEGDGYEYMNDVAVGYANEGCTVRAQRGERGLNVHFPSQGDMQIITATEPQEVTVGGKVSFEVHGDREKLLASRVFDANDFGPETVTVDIADVQELKLVVDAEGGIGCDHAVWADARLVDTGGNEVYLSDLPETDQFVHGGLRRDVDYYGTQIRIAGKDYEKGLTLHPEGAAGWATWDLGGEYVQFIADLGLDNGRDDEVGEQQVFRRTCMARKTADTTRFIAVIEPYTKAAAVEGVSIEGETLKIAMKDGETRSVDLSAMDGLADRPDARPYDVVYEAGGPPVASLAFFEDGVERDTISWPEETVRCHQSVDDRWMYIESNATEVQPGEEYHITAQYIHSYNYVLPPALKVYQYDAEGALISWEYLQRRLPNARQWRDIDLSFNAAEDAATAKGVICTRGIGTLWV
ncbi:MAG: NPCBM/NEW2 domain-containing protein, partial [Armatimonadota bacterium]